MVRVWLPLLKGEHQRDVLFNPNCRSKFLLVTFGKENMYFVKIYC